MPDEEAMAFEAGELEEFLAADESPVPVDRAFKERLRARLWRMLEEQRARAGGEAGQGDDDAPDGSVARTDRDE